MRLLILVVMVSSILVGPLFINCTARAETELKKEMFSPEEWERMKKLGVISDEKLAENKGEGKGVLGVTAGSRVIMRTNDHIILLILIPLKKADKWGKFWDLDRSRPAYFAKLDEQFYNVTIEEIIPGIYELYASIKFPQPRGEEDKCVIFRFKVNLEADTKGNLILSPMSGDTHQGNTAIGLHADFRVRPDPPPRSRPQISGAVQQIEKICLHSTISRLKTIERKLATSKEKNSFEESGLKIIVRKGAEKRITPSTIKRVEKAFQSSWRSYWVVNKAPKIDGVIKEGEWGNFTSIPLYYVVTFKRGRRNDALAWDKKNKTARICFMNDAVNLYMCVIVPGKYVNEDFQVASFHISLDFKSGIIDSKILHIQYNKGIYPYNFWLTDGSFKKALHKWGREFHRVDIEGCYSHTSKGLLGREGCYTVEMCIPLNSGDPCDITINPGDKIKFYVHYVEATGWTEQGTYAVSSLWQFTRKHVDAIAPSKYGKLKLSVKE